MGHSQKSAAHGHESHGSYSTYISVFVALLVLTAISFAVGNSSTLREKTPGIMWIAMMAVSTAKAMLVILYFMHLKWEANWKYVLTVPCSIMSVFLVLMLIPDVGQRTRDYAEERWLYATDPTSHSEEHVSHSADEHTHADGKKHSH
jgi:cytochrome c oxidase subunit IV